MTQDFLPGLRILKTVLAVFICLLIFYLFEYYNPTYAVVTCVLMMRTSVEESFKAGIDRVFGTLLGGAIAIAILFLMRSLGVHTQTIPAVFFIAGAVFITLMISKILKLSPYVGSMSSVIILIAMISYGQVGDEPHIYIGIRVFETIIGIGISVLVNRYFNPDFERLKSK